MAIKAGPTTTTGAPTGVASSVRGRSKDPNRGVYTAEDKLLNLVLDADVLWRGASLATLKGVGSFNKAVDNATKQLEYYNRKKETSSTATNINLDRELQ